MSEYEDSANKNIKSKQSIISLTATHKYNLIKTNNAIHYDTQCYMPDKVYYNNNTHKYLVIKQPYTIL